MAKGNKVRHRIRYGEVTGSVRRPPVTVQFSCSCGGYQGTSSARLEAGARVIAEGRIGAHAAMVRAEKRAP